MGAISGFGRTASKLGWSAPARSGVCLKGWVQEFFLGPQAPGTVPRITVFAEPELKSRNNRFRSHNFDIIICNKEYIVITRKGCLYPCNTSI